MQFPAFATTGKVVSEAMVKGLGKVRLGRCVAAVTEFRLPSRQQKFRLLRMMRGVAIQATDIVIRMRRRLAVTLLMFLRMTAEAALIGFGPGELGKTHDLLAIATALHVRPTRPVAGFTSVTIGFGGLEVSRHLEVLVEILVTGLAGFHARILRLHGRCRVGIRLGSLGRVSLERNQTPSDRRACNGKTRLPTLFLHRALLD
jgi:hypothetical protein